MAQLLQNLVTKADKKKKVMGQNCLTKKFDSFRKWQKRPFIRSVSMKCVDLERWGVGNRHPSKAVDPCFSLVMSETTLSAFVRCELIFQYRIMRQTRFVIMAKLRGDYTAVYCEGFVISIVKVKTSTIFSQGFMWSFALSWITLELHSFKLISATWLLFCGSWSLKNINTLWVNIFLLISKKKNI